MIQSFQPRALRRSVHIVMLLALGVAMLLYTVCRVLFYFFNIGFFEETSFSDLLYLMWGGLRFDLVAVLYTNLLFIALMLLPFRFRHHPVYRKVVKWVFLVFNSIGIALNCVDFIYYRFTLRRTTGNVVKEFGNEDWGGFVFSFLVDFWYVAVIWVALVALMAWLYNRIKLEKAPVYNPWFYYPWHTVLLVLTVGLSIGAMRGGFRHSTRPITLSNAGEYVERPQEMYIVLNTPFSVIRTINKTSYQKVDYFPEPQVAQLYSPIHQPADSARFRKKNVVVIILESFGKEAVGGYNRHLENGTYTGFTPFLDSLMLHSKVYWNSFANGRKSIDALPSVLTSIPSIQEPFVLTQYVSNNLPSLPRTLGQQGYHTSFFHGAPNGSMGFDAFMNLIGVQEYYGMTEYGKPEDFDGMWGIWDEEFLQFMAGKLNMFREPFMSAVFTTSSHHPFKLPARYQGKFKKGPYEIFETIGYTDMALRKFFQKASQAPWFKNTLFVITADHSATFTHYTEYQTALGNFAVPLLFYAPGDSTFRGVERERVVQQLDIMPTVLGYLGYNQPYFSFGKNMLQPQEGNFAISYQGGYQWTEGDYFLQFDGTKTLGLFNYKEDKFLKKNLKDTQPQLRIAMENKLKAFIQQYNNRMLENRLQP
ncbi:alkaline phosphatase family protein [Rufibacter immobilis]|uniref:Alkaline phosphatase family protein n=1 Tax=Rufibacter immobilis TaxID=1348778 RepID=A0A3M9MXI8_9BACT|nr:alkaline phosphatase family protein [Rufibacter immobilis]RNI30261.1 alkaline phosphatase family protein [Rufibacter immobilis]